MIPLVLTSVSLVFGLIAPAGRISRSPARALDPKILQATVGAALPGLRIINRVGMSLYCHSRLYLAEN